MTKKLALYEKVKFDDRSDVKQFMTGVVTIKDPVTGETIFTKGNKIIIHGSSYTAQKHFPDLPLSNSTITYNEALGLDRNNPINNINEERIVLFSAGTDGCGVDAHQVRHVEYADWCDPSSLIPFRYLNASNDEANRDIYFGRKNDISTGMISYYFKIFDTEPQWTQRYIADGAPLENNIYDSTRKDEIESFVELKLKISTEDCREYFEETTGINNAKINTISLLTAIPEVVDGTTYYQDIRPLTKINFPNQTLSELNKGLDIIYHIYY